MSAQKPSIGSAGRLAAEASTLPVPESDEERAILARFGFTAPSMVTRQIELHQKAL